MPEIFRSQGLGKTQIQREREMVVSELAGYWLQRISNARSYRANGQFPKKRCTLSPVPAILRSNKNADIPEKCAHRKVQPYLELPCGT
jgi:hypothetical protein